MGIDWEDILDAEGEDMADAYEENVYDAAYAENSNPNEGYDALKAACSRHIVDDEDDFYDDEEVTEDELAAYFGDGASGKEAEAGKAEPEDRTKKAAEKAAEKVAAVENAYGKEDPSDPFRSFPDIRPGELDEFLE